MSFVHPTDSTEPGERDFERARSCDGVSPTERSSLRLRAIRALYQGIDRETVRIFCKVSERTVLYWIERFNECGIDGLIRKRNAGRPRKVERQKVRKSILKLVDHPEEAQETHWTGRKLHGYLKEELKLEVSSSWTTPAGTKPSA